LETRKAIDLQAEVLVRLEKSGLNDPKLRNIIRILSELSDALFRYDSSPKEYDYADIQMNMQILARDVASLIDDISNYGSNRRMISLSKNPRFHLFYAIFTRDIKVFAETITAGIDFVMEGTLEGRERAAYAFQAALEHLNGNAKEA
jgi:hypothetical protein